MKTKYIIQIKRGYFWEDVLNFFDEKQALVYQLKLISQGINARVIQIFFI